MHFPNQWLQKFGHNTQARWAQTPDGTLVIFVHGFKGKSVGTWKQFQKILVSQGEMANADIIFYGYDGLGARIDFSAHFLEKFLRSLLGAPTTVPLTPVRRPASFQYSRVVLVAHSMGAIVLRRALLLLLPTFIRRPSLGRPIRLVFFAPAHSGVVLTELIKESKDYWHLLQQIVLFGRAAKPALNDMNDPATFTNLKTDTLAALNSGPRNCFVAFSTIFGEFENVVQHQQFCQDPRLGHPRFHVIPLKGHSSVCKPINGTDDAVRYVLEAIK